jgi:hypothetical protein
VLRGLQCFRFFCCLLHLLMLGGSRTFQKVQSSTACSRTIHFVAFVSIGFLMTLSEVLSFISCTCFLTTRSSIIMLNSRIPLAVLSLPHLLRIFPLHTAGTAHRITLLWVAANFFQDTPFPCVQFLNLWQRIQ